MQICNFSAILWCVLEFALFCGENEDGALVFLPVGRALTAVAFFLGFGVLRDLGEWAQGGVSFAGVFYGLNMTAVVVYACHTQLAFLDQVNRIEHDLRNFSLAKAECSDERDRQHVERVIEKCWATAADARPSFEAVGKELRTLSQLPEEVLRGWTM